MDDGGFAASQCGGDEGRGNDECRSGERCTRDGRSGERRTQSSQNRGWYSRGYLPHFDSPHVIQHITYRLADSLPRAALEGMLLEIEASIRGDEQRKAALRQRIEAYLDSGYGCCVLRTPEVAACVVETWQHFDGVRYRLLEWVVMPNHCHVLIEPFEGAPLGKIVLSWKNYTARFINDFRSGLALGASEGSGDGETGARMQVWQREYWDRFIRNEGHFEAVKQYIVMNPVKAGLALRPEAWPWSSAKERTDGVEKR